MMTRILTTFFLLFFSCSVFAQISWPDSTVQAITYWDLYDSVGYEVQLDKIKLANGDTTSHQIITYDVAVTVIDSTSSGYLVEWYYYNFDIQGADPISEKIMKVSEDVAIEIITDELGVIQGVQNWEEVRNYTYDVIDKVFKDFGNPTVEQVISGVKSMYATEEGITYAAIQDAQQFHSFFGLAYTMGERIEGMIQVPNLYNPEEPFDAEVNMELFKLNKESNSYTLLYVHQVDSEQLLAATLKYLESIGLPQEALGEIENLNLVNTVAVESTIHNSGWLLDSYQIKEVVADQSREVEIRSILMK